MMRVTVLALLPQLGVAGNLRVQNATLREGAVMPNGPYQQTLNNFQNVQYFADFNIGGQKIQGIFDTGSFELLVRSKRCKHCAHPTPAYDFQKSNTYSKNGTVEQHVFGSGPCVSMMGYESVGIGPMEVKRQAFWEIIDHQIPVLDKAKFAAIVGIGPDFAYGNREHTLLMSYGVDEFSVCLQRASGSNGVLTWGPNRASSFASAPVIGNHHWVTKMTDVHFGTKGGLLTGKSLPCAGTGCAVIVDSGTSLIAAPGVALMQLSEQIGPIQEDCSNLDQLPMLRFSMGGEEFELPPQAYVMRITGSLMEADSIWDMLFFKPKTKKLDMCMPAFMQMDMMSQHGPVWIMGMPFFRFYHTSFDRKAKQMHFASAGPKCEAEPFPKRANKDVALLSNRRQEDYKPLDVEVDQLVPPTLSEQMDFPFTTNGEIEL